MMIDRVFTGLTLAIHKEFPESHIYTDEVLQGFQAGDFIVGLQKFDKKNLPGGVKQCTAVFTLAYFCGEDREVLFGVAERLCALLEVIPLSSGVFLRSYPTVREIKEGILRMNLRSVYQAVSEKETEKMEELHFAEEEKQ